MNGARAASDPDDEGTVYSETQQFARAWAIEAVAPILQWVEKPEVEEITINRPNEIWLRLRKPDENGAIWVSRKDDRLDRETLETMLHVLANVNNTPGFGPTKNPITYGTLPGGHRYAGGYGPNLQYYSGETDVNGTVILTVRQAPPRTSSVSFEDYGLVRGRELAPYDLVADRKSDGGDPIGRILCSINRGDHILISGATGSGKTTLMNSMAQKLSKKLRIITVQDVPEINLVQPNRLHIMMPRAGSINDFTYKSVVDLVVRTTPDVVLAGEISTSNAATVWELMKSGHGSFMTTIHAESVSLALSTFMTRIAHSNKEEVADREKVEAEMRRMLRIIQVIRRDDGSRKIVEIN